MALSLTDEQRGQAHHRLTMLEQAVVGVATLHKALSAHVNTARPAGPAPLQGRPAPTPPALPCKAQPCSFAELWRGFLRVWRGNVRLCRGIFGHAVALFSPAPAL